jgi:nicotinamide-nucleotide amidase
MTVLSNLSERSEHISVPRAKAKQPVEKAPLNRSLFATLPGVPAEMHRMFEETLEPIIRERSEGVIVSLMLKFAGISEEELGEKLRDLLAVPDPTVAPLVGPVEIGQGEVHLRITTRASTQEEANKKIKPVAQEVLSRLGEYYLGPRQT